MHGIRKYGIKRKRELLIIAYCIIAFLSVHNNGNRRNEGYAEYGFILFFYCTMPKDYVKLLRKLCVLLSFRLTDRTEDGNTCEQDGKYFGVSFFLSIEEVFVLWHM